MPYDHEKSYKERRALMGNLGYDQSMTTMAKKLGGPIVFMGLLVLIGAVGGVLITREYYKSLLEYKDSER